MTSSAHAQQVDYVNRSTDNGDTLTGEGTSVGGFSGDLRYCLIRSQRYQNPHARTTTTIIMETAPTLSRPLPPWTPNVAQDLTIRDDGQVARDSLNNKDLTLATDASKVTIRIGYTGQTFTLQRSATLTDADFHTLETFSPQDGTTGTVLTFIDTSPSASEPFYRILVTP